ncbi:MAG TPA: hypothetical protein O0W81_04675 [Methanocorpusculum sp.]|nr:hypothetical protein [Methanocorpusculum sp.]
MLRHNLCISGETIGKIRGRCAVIQVKPFTELLFQPLFCSPQSPLFLNGKENFVQAKEFVFALGLFRHKAANVFMVCIGIGVDRRICQRVFVYKVINKF